MLHRIIIIYSHVLLYKMIMVGDTGALLPNVSSQHVVIKGINDEEPKQDVTWPCEASDRPYQWLQWICGMYNIPKRKGCVFDFYCIMLVYVSLSNHYT